MSIFNIFNRGNQFNEGVEKARNTAGAVLLDVRTEEEFKSGHVPGAINIPLDDLYSTDLDKGTPLFVYCLSGARSRQACSYLKGQGYETTNIGGISSYSGEIERER